MKSYINAYGVHVFISPYGVLLTYSQDSKGQIEIPFVSVQQVLEKMNAASLNSITGNSLLRLALADGG